MFRVLRGLPLRGSAQRWLQIPTEFEVRTAHGDESGRLCRRDKGKRPGTASCLAGLAERPLPGAWLTLESERRGTVPDPLLPYVSPN